MTTEEELETLKAHFAATQRRLEADRLALSREEGKVKRLWQTIDAFAGKLPQAEAYAILVEYEITESVALTLHEWNNYGDEVRHQLTSITGTMFGTPWRRLDGEAADFVRGAAINVGHIGLADVFLKAEGEDGLWAACAEAFHRLEAEAKARGLSCAAHLHLLEEKCLAQAEKKAV